MLYQILARILGSIIRLLAWSIKHTYVNSETLEAAKKIHPQGGLIFAVWHQDCISGVLCQENVTSMNVMVSRSKDGDLAAYFCKIFGHTSVRGSSRKGNVDKGGQKALENLVISMKNGRVGAITIDGPKGPKYEVKKGVLKAARDSGVPIITGSPYCTNIWQLSSWDELKIPKFFSHITTCYGNPIIIPAETTDEELHVYQEMVKESLFDVQKKAREFYFSSRKNSGY